ncbi:MAG: nicotinate-nucleotide adenylyltransferase [Tissierellia bacterium]|jgi:nicotinate-nucleotide adenylyltransferase|nr:nicotinate-nucleotide adenylyltransferase [Tissierellia bacterium]
MTQARIGIFGGSFDPIHVGHLMLAQAALERFQLDKVLFMPAKLSPFKQKLTMTKAETRCFMVELAIQGNQGFEVSDLELNRPEPSYTIDTIRILKQQYPGVKIYFIAGADSIMELEGWMTFEELLQEVVFLAAYRPSHTRAQLESEVMRLNKKYQADIRLVDFPDIDISSSYIRETIMRGGSARYLVPDKVLEFIHNEGVYRDRQRN